MSRIRNLIRGNRFAGLEAEMLPDGICMHLVIIRKKGKQVTIQKNVSGLLTVEALEKELPKDIPLHLSFTGKGILHRKINADPASDSKTLLHKALPNASLQDFYLQTCEGSRDERWISLIRKVQADEWILQLTEKQFSLISIGIGPMAVSHVYALMENQPEELISGNQRLIFEDGKIAAVDPIESGSGNKEYSIGGEKIAAVLLTAFASAFQQLVASERQVRTEAEVLLNANENFFQRKLFKTGAAALLLVALLILLVNFIFFSSYREQQSELQNRIQYDGGTIQLVKQLEAQAGSKRTFLEQAGLLQTTHYAYLADQLAAGLPEEIRLTKLDFSPRLKLAEEDTIGFRPGEIDIAGRCSESIVLNRWIQEMKNQHWVRSATLKSYMQDKSMSQGAFEVKIEIE